MNEQNKAVIIMNLGSPDSFAVNDLKKYLTEFLMDGKVIDKPYLIRSLLVKGAIVPFRAKQSSEAYKKIWTDEGSPLIVFTNHFKNKLQKKIEAPIEVVMRYRNPSATEVLQKLHLLYPQLEDILVVPLYPHYAMSSYETAVEDIKAVHRKRNYSSGLKIIKPFYNNEAYLHALAESIRPYLQNDYDKILFSYHGLPVRHIYKSDITGSHCLKTNDCCHVASTAHQFCYRHQTTATTEQIIKMLEIPKEKAEQTFQSRLGRDPWLLPSTQERLPQLPGEGVKKLAVVCPAFVSDCLETLEEIAIRAKEVFLNAGGEAFTFIPCLNTQELWVQTVAGWINDYFKGSKEMLFQNI